MKTLFIPFLMILLVSCSKVSNNDELNTDDIRYAEKLTGLQFSPAERDSMLEGLQRALNSYEQLHEFPIPNHIPPSLVFNPVPPDFDIPSEQKPLKWIIPQNLELPSEESELAFYDLPSLASLIRDRKISSVELTVYYIDRLKKYNDSLHCLVTLTEEYALHQAALLDEELESGHYRGILHGIPYGIKDLFAFPGYPTTWGAGPYQEQYIDDTAEVITRLEEAGAVLIGKLTLGALAMGDIWFGGKTRNPWDTGQGSSGSSAGSAAATVAGLVPFAIGTETWGSIVSPSTRCGATGLRPTFGRVSRSGAMALSWSMDKIGPICRSAYDCAIVFNAIRGADKKDPGTMDAAFNYRDMKDLSGLKVGYLKDLFETEYRSRQYDSISLLVFSNLGAELIPVRLPDSIPLRALSIILSAEAAAAFDQLTRTDLDSLLVRQDKNAWPNSFRQARFIPAVEYIQANRIRYQLITGVNQLFRQYDVIITPSFGGNQLLMTNLTGHPCLVMPNGFTEEGRPVSISLLGNLFDEATLLAVAKLYQEATDFEDRHPPMFK